MVTLSIGHAPNVGGGLPPIGVVQSMYMQADTSPSGASPLPHLNLLRIDDNKNNIVRLELPGAGRGYRPNKMDSNNPLFNPSMNGAEMKLREDGTPFSLFPIKE